MNPAESMRRKRVAAVIGLLLMVATAANPFFDLGLLGQHGRLAMALVWIFAGIFLITNIPAKAEFDSVRKRRGS